VVIPEQFGAEASDLSAPASAGRS